MAALAIFREDFAGRILPFDTEAAVVYADIFAARRRTGRPAATGDLMIASIRVRPQPAKPSVSRVTTPTPRTRAIDPWTNS
jgi:hypothetical protein